MKHSHNLWTSTQLTARYHTHWTHHIFVTFSSHVTAWQHIKGKLHHKHSLCVFPERMASQYNLGFEHKTDTVMERAGRAVTLAKAPSPSPIPTTQSTDHHRDKTLGHPASSILLLDLTPPCVNKSRANLFLITYGGGFFLPCEDLGRMFDHSFPASAFFSLLFLFWSGD